MSKEQKSKEYADWLHKNLEEQLGHKCAKHDMYYRNGDIQQAFDVGWDEALKSQWVNADESLPYFDDAESIENKKRYIVRTMYVGTTNEISYNMAYMRSRYKFNVETDRIKVTHWMPIPSFDEILEANKDVLKRLKDK